MPYVRETEVPRSPEETFAYLADFSTTAEWDPGIAEARRLTPEPTVVGSRFELIAVFRGNRQRFEYRVTQIEDGKRIALYGDGEKAITIDEITLSPTANGTRIHYEAEFRLKGLRRVAEPFLGSTFRKIGDAAMDGLSARLSR
jgi:carbon monoxide dehydrogenase subunit G